jgi:hypothetical protein
MLSKKDKEFLIREIRSAVKEELTVEIEMEKNRDERTGQKLAKSEKFIEKVFLPSMILQMLPYHEGALRGMQEDISKNNCEMAGFQKKFVAMAELILATEKSLKCIAALSDRVKQIPFESGGYIESSN